MKAVEQGHTKAHYNLGMMYVDGFGVTQDYKTANKWFSRAAEQGDIYAPSNLGYMYQQGYGVIQDYRLALMWLNISASQGNKEALVNRNMLELKMIPADIAKANKLARECVAKNYKDC
jgi:TPR repeat protein